MRLRGIWRLVIPAPPSLALYTVVASAYQAYHDAAEEAHSRLFRDFCCLYL